MKISVQGTVIDTDLIGIITPVEELKRINQSLSFEIKFRTQGLNPVMIRAKDAEDLCPHYKFYQLKEHEQMSYKVASYEALIALRNVIIKHWSGKKDVPELKLIHDENLSHI